jgi:hypothetical protein
MDRDTGYFSHGSETRSIDADLVGSLNFDFATFGSVRSDCVFHVETLVDSVAAQTHVELTVATIAKVFVFGPLGQRKVDRRIGQAEMLLAILNSARWTASRTSWERTSRRHHTRRTAVWLFVRHVTNVPLRILSLRLRLGRYLVLVPSLVEALVWVRGLALVPSLGRRLIF